MISGRGVQDIFATWSCPWSFPPFWPGGLSFTLSIDDVIISFFTTGPTFEVLPLRIYSMVRLGLKPGSTPYCAIMKFL